MSERILKALMQLFALIAKNEGLGKGSMVVVKGFLGQQLNKELVYQYMAVFDQYYEKYHGNIKGADEKKKKRRISSSSVKILRICTDINAELTQKQKVIVLFRLLEFAGSDGTIDGQELDFVATVSSTFNIDDQEFLRCLTFVRSTRKDAQDSERVLVVNQRVAPRLEHAHHIHIDGFQGELRFLDVSSVGLYVFRYLGKDTVFINGQPVRSNQVNIFSSGSTVRGSGNTAIYYSDVVSRFLRSSVQSEFVLEAKDLEHYFPSGKQGLHPLKFSEKSGQMLGLMGASGAGKSTLLNLLNGTMKPSKGQVLLNGIDIYKDADKVEGLIGHISQDDLLMEELTVFQNLYFNAKLCFDGLNNYQVTKRVIATLKDLGLYEIKDLKVGSPMNKKVSGGQRKRLNIALELIREPSVLFVDEPTSGLSSRDSENIMDLLKELALKGKLVIVVIHQPSSDIYKMFDKLMILDTGGFPVYFGNPIEAISYFKAQINDVTSDDVECFNCGNVNPEQVFNILEAQVLDEFGQVTYKRRVSPEEWNEKYLDNIVIEDADVDLSQPLPEGASIPSRLQQFRVFVTRDVLSKLADMQYMVINFLETPVLAFILAMLIKYFANDDVGFVFRENDNLPAYIFMCVVVALFFGLTVSAEEIIKDARILKRESFLNLSRTSYLGSKIMILFAISAVQTMAFVLVGNWIMEIKGMNMAYFLVLFSTSCFANMLGLNISASFRNVVTIYILIPFLIIPQLLLSGVIVKFDKLNPEFSSDAQVPFAGEIMTSKWAYEALAVYQFKKNKFSKDFYEFDKGISEATYKKDYWIPEIRNRAIELSDPVRRRKFTPKALKTIILLRNELNDQAVLTPDLVFSEIADLDTTVITKITLESIKAYMAQLARHYVRQRNTIDTEKDRMITSKIRTADERVAFNKMKDDYFNESLSDLVLNSNDFYRIIERDGHLIQKLNPIYQDPFKSNFLRSQFFAPRKKIMSYYIDTYWANVLVIWLMSLFLMFTLYFNVLERSLSFVGEMIERIPLRKKRE
ncbi:MAG: ABC-type multidrug transport system ATPase subunit [Oceanospirillaceae bacterium]|jgi:ABC-type multidrug transport system ATPase subunit